MINLGVAVFAVLGLLACVSDWRRGVMVSMAVGFLQDPVRKIMPGQPVFLSAIVVVFVATTVAGIYLRSGRPSLAPLYRFNRRMRRPLRLFVVLVFIEAGVAYVRTDSLVIPAIGLLAYLSPIPTLMLGMYFARSQARVRSFLATYAFLSVLFTAGVMLSYLGVQSRLLDQIGFNIIAFSPTGEKLRLLPGLFRTPEVAAWHMATATCCLWILFVSSRRSSRYISVVLAASSFLLLGTLFTGRRKFLLEVVFFLVFYGILSVMLHLRNRRFLGLIGSAAIALVIGGAIIANTAFASDLAPYLARGMSVGGDAGLRFRGMTVDAFQYIINVNGWFGSGAGTGSQGSQHFGGGSRIIGEAAEGGIGKLLAELGVPALVLALWLLIEMARAGWAALRTLQKSDEESSALSLACASLVLANLPLYSIAHQIFGDVFVLLMLGWICGFSIGVLPPAVISPSLRPRRSPGHWPAGDVPGGSIVPTPTAV